MAFYLGETTLIEKSTCVYNTLATTIDVSSAPSRFSLGDMIKMTLCNRCWIVPHLVFQRWTCLCRLKAYLGMRSNQSVVHLRLLLLIARNPCSVIWEAVDYPLSM